MFEISMIELFNCFDKFDLNEKKKIYFDEGNIQIDPWWRVPSYSSRRRFIETIGCLRERKCWPLRMDYCWYAKNMPWSCLSPIVYRSLSLCDSAQYRVILKPSLTQFFPTQCTHSKPKTHQRHTTLYHNKKRMKQHMIYIYIYIHFQLCSPYLVSKPNNLCVFIKQQTTIK